MKPPYPSTLMHPSFRFLLPASIACAAGLAAAEDNVAFATVHSGTVTPAAATHFFTVAGEEREEATFLGVETMPVTSTLTAQLNLPKNCGLVVRQVVADSPAAAVLRVDDVLLKLDDQLLIESRQFAVLVRNKQPGDEVTLTYIRGGKQATAKVKLVKREVPKLGASFEERLPFGGGIAGQALPGVRWEGAVPAEKREQVNSVLQLMRPVPALDPARISIERRGGLGFKATSIDTANSKLLYTDDQGTLELTTVEGKKSLVAKDAKGAEVFSGPISTPDERNAMPPAVRERLEKLEGMQDVTFRTDGQLREAEVKVFRPAARGIALPLPPAFMPAPRQLL